MSFSNILFGLNCLICTFFVFSNNLVYAQLNYNSASGSHSSITVSPYNYPLANPFFATLSYIAVQPTKNVKYKIISVDPHPERSNLRYYGKYHTLHLAFFNHQNNPTAPLIFIVPGLGSSPLNHGTLYLSELFYDAGFNVLTLPATLSWQFALSVSRSGFPGYSPIDAEDLLYLMKSVDSNLRNNEYIRPRNYALLGYSLGALDSSFIANLDLQKHFFNFERILMINPPLQKDKCITSIDGLTNISSALSSSEQIALLEYANSKLTDAKTYLGNTEFSLGLSDSQMAWIIGSNFRNSLNDVLLLSQEIDNQGIFLTPPTSAWQRLRKIEAYTFNFRDYINWFVFAKLKNSQSTMYNFNSPADLISRSDMRSQLLELSKNNANWAVYHNQDDFIFQNGDLEFLLKSTSESRIYPLGGHLGNIWFKQNRQDILNYFAPLFDSSTSNPK